ncbi:MAG: hypothetical protein Kow0013_07110 [Pararhodobacter sp.]
MDGLTAAPKAAIEDRMTRNRTTPIAAMINQERGAPFRGNPMTNPAAGTAPADRRRQRG